METIVYDYEKSPSLIFLATWRVYKSTNLQTRRHPAQAEATQLKAKATEEVQRELVAWPKLNTMDLSIACSESKCFIVIVIVVVIVILILILIIITIIIITSLSLSSLSSSSSSSSSSSVGVYIYIYIECIIDALTVSSHTDMIPTGHERRCSLSRLKSIVMSVVLKPLMY